MTDLREQQLAWLENILSSSGLTLTDIARRARLNPSTLTRFRARDDGGHTLTSRTVKKIEDATGVPAYEVRTRPREAPIFSEGEATPFEFAEATQDLLVEALRAVVARSNAVDLWVLKTGSLAGVGYDPGDIVVVDREAVPRSGDAVCAQKYDWRRGTAETIFRVYRTPYLLTAALSGEPGMPEIVDDESVVIKGVVVGGCHLRH
ncbi:helix-turn-helix domain-containing protein [Rhizobium sp. CAU 1783]